MVKIIEKSSFQPFFMAFLASLTSLVFSFLPKIKKTYHYFLSLLGLKLVRKADIIKNPTDFLQDLFIYNHYYARLAARLSEASIFSQRFS